MTDNKQVIETLRTNTFKQLKRGEVFALQDGGWQVYIKINTRDALLLADDWEYILTPDERILYGDYGVWIAWFKPWEEISQLPVEVQQLWKTTK